MAWAIKVSCLRCQMMSFSSRDFALLGISESSRKCTWGWIFFSRKKQAIWCFYLWNKLYFQHAADCSSKAHDFITLNPTQSMPNFNIILKHIVYVLKLHFLSSEAAVVIIINVEAVFLQK